MAVSGLWPEQDRCGAFPRTGDVGRRRESGPDDFVSYSHADDRWRRRFRDHGETAETLRPDRVLVRPASHGGKAEKQIEAAMAKATVAVLLVSDNFLASDYIMRKEVPYFLKAHRERGFLFYGHISPRVCLSTTEIKTFQAMTLGDLKPLVNMGEFEWKQTLLTGCRWIDEHLKKLEKPVPRRSAQWQDGSA